MFLLCVWSVYDNAYLTEKKLSNYPLSHWLVDTSQTLIRKGIQRAKNNGVEYVSVWCFRLPIFLVTRTYQEAIKGFIYIWYILINKKIVNL